VSGGEYLLGLILIITGLAITDIVVSLHQVLLNRRHVEWDWLSLLAAAYIFLMIVNSWGLSFQAFNRGDVNPPLWQFLELLGQIIPLYLAARASLPDQVPPEGVDLAQHYASVSRYFWSAVAATLVLYFVGTIFDSGTVGSAIFMRAGAAAQLLLILPLIVFKSRRVHAIVVPAIFAIFCFDHLTVPLFG
jgi:hypothetical protein